jgi:hypothetical protein
VDFPTAHDPAVAADAYRVGLGLALAAVRTDDPHGDAFAQIIEVLLDGLPCPWENPPNPEQEAFLAALLDTLTGLIGGVSMATAVIAGHWRAHSRTAKPVNVVRDLIAKAAK